METGLAKDSSTAHVDLGDCRVTPESGIGRPREREHTRKRSNRSRNIRVARATRNESARAEERAHGLELTLERPRTRAECVDGPRPCPYVGCKHHLYLDVSPQTGTIKLNFPDLEVWELAETCALDLAERGALSLEQTSNLLNLTRERIRQIEARALERLGALEQALALLR